MWNKPWAKPGAAVLAAGALFAIVSVIVTREGTGRGAHKGSPVDRLSAFSREVGLSPSDALCSRDSKESSYEARATLYRGAPKPFQLDKFSSFSPAGDLGQAPAALLPGAALTAGWPAEAKCAWPKGIDRAMMRRKDLLLRRGTGADAEWLIFSVNSFEDGTTYTEARLMRAFAPLPELPARS